VEATELRIGNYYRRMYGHGYEDIVKATIEDIVEINTKPWSDHVWHDGIELTEDWIINLGFGTTKIYQKCYIKSVCCILINNDGLYEYVPSPFMPITTIKYVHQLQNLYFALTNQELIITE
jgi:hypothetical protein